jgi:hypothetical protein
MPALGGDLGCFVHAQVPRVAHRLHQPAELLADRRRQFEAHHHRPDRAVEVLRGGGVEGTLLGLAPERAGRRHRLARLRDAFWRLVDEGKRDRRVLQR